MDVGKEKDRPALQKRNLLFGVVTYAAGRLGKEPIRSQGHAHAVSPSCNCSTPEVYEIWRGRAVILMQESLADDPGRCVAVEAAPGDVVVVPPAWGHATISADPDQPLTFGAWCVRDYGYEYDGVRRHGGLAYFPILTEGDTGIQWRRNPAYYHRELIEKEPADYSGLSIDPDVPIYRQFEQDPDRFLFVSEPSRVSEAWDGFVP
jgi:glucose-6-phosphate isomerase